MMIIISSCDLFAPPEPVVLSEEEHQIVSALLNKTGAYGNTLLLVNETRSIFKAKELKRFIEWTDINYDSTIFDKYDELQKQPGFYDQNLLPDTVILLDPGYLDEYKDTCCSFENELNALYPGTDGYIYFSRPVISEDGVSAVLEYQHICGIGCGGWGAAYIIKENGVWKYHQHFVTAIAKK